MYLKKILASGFKSFADKTSIDLARGITGIVGPNGSGKSNVVDAVRWVLGEQSVKSLRGTDTMTDVIFSGSKSRNAMNMASVTLVFDNSDLYLHIDYTEVAIRRRVYKDGTNEYAINEKQCRLKDITDLLLDSGIAKESFNIISQGKVEEIISDKPENRRVIFEEAACVLKYKKRKEEALRKLEKTHDNVSRVDDIVHELEIQVEPLKLQKEQALLYQEKSEQLKQLEITLLASEITAFNFEYQTNKGKIEALNQEIIVLNTKTIQKETEISDSKNKLTLLEEEINEKQKELLKQTQLVEQIQSKKTMLLERQKYQVEDAKLHQTMIALKEEESSRKIEIGREEGEVTLLEEKYRQIQLRLQTLEKQLSNLKIQKEKYNQILTVKIKERYQLENKIAILKDNIETNASLPSGVRAVLNHPKLNGIHDVIGNIIEVPETYMTAITTSLGFASSYVIVDHENAAKEAIAYLKENKLGRVTFFPLSIIGPKFVDQDTLRILKDEPGFMGVASKLVANDPTYQNIIDNQLGNVLVIDGIANANRIHKKIRYRYKMVTLDGELFHVGGSLTGGTTVQNRNPLQEKQALENYLRQQKQVENEIQQLEDDINICDASYQELENKQYVVHKEAIQLQQQVTSKQNLLIKLKEELERITTELTGTDSLLKKTISTEEVKLMDDYTKALEEKTKLESLLDVLQLKQKEMKEKNIEQEFETKRENSLLTTKNKELKNLEIEVNRLDVKLDNLLGKLNETYSMTYEKALTFGPLTMEPSEARQKVSLWKQEIKELGPVNLGSISEYDRVRERYEFLIHQKEDLQQAETTLLEIIAEMDQVMEREFTKTFEVIRNHFKTTFQELFHGGSADLKLTDPTDMLHTGIEIVASPPGKTLKGISFLSGGEKTFTAISLLFAILKSRPVPYCILDEVEAALDEVNVDSFGAYLQTLKDQTQFILITHKKKTMEYADVLYGITMQESGVSKLVSVKLEEVKK